MATNFHIWKHFMVCISGQPGTNHCRLWAELKYGCMQNRPFAQSSNCAVIHLHGTQSEYVSDAHATVFTLKTRGRFPIDQSFS